MSVLRCLGWSIVPSLLLKGFSLLAADIAAAPAGASTPGFRPLVAADRTATPLLAPASKEGEIRLKQFRHAPGLKMDLWAAEPMLANPVAFSVDERGRVFTSETYRYRTSVLDIRHYMFMLEDDLASRSIEDRLATIRKWFGPEGEQALSQETEVVRLIEDTNHDGKADTSSVFADGLNSPLDGIASGVLARRGSVWLTDIPSLWRFSPSAGGPGGEPAGQRASGPAGQTIPSPPSGSRAFPPAGPPAFPPPTVHAPNYTATELLRGFGVRFSYTGHDLHGLIFGPDGRLYFSCGDRGTHIVTQEGTVIDLPDEGAVFRCEPDGSQLEVVHRGLRNPQELAFNEYGDLFTGDNDSDQGDRERWVQVIEGADSGWRVGHQHAPLGNAGMWNLERLWVPHFEGQAAYLLPPIANIGDGPGGLVFDATHRYGGESTPSPTLHAPRSTPHATFLLAYFKGTSAKSGIYALTVKPNGAGYELVGHDEFVWNALVPDVDLAPDGSIFFADWHEGWPKSNKGRLYRAYLPDVVADPAMRETATLLGERMSQRGETELLALLAHRDMRVRQEAQFELAARGPKSFAGLRGVALKSKDRFARIHAIWGMGQIIRHAPSDALSDEAFPLTRLWTDPDREVLGQALLALGDAKMADMFAPLPQLMSQLDKRQIRQALTGLGRLWRNGGEFQTWKRTLAGKIRDSLPANLKADAVSLSEKLGLELWKKGPPLPDWPGLTYLETNSAVSPEMLTTIVSTSLNAIAGFQEFIFRKDHPSRAVRLATILALRRNGGELAEIPPAAGGLPQAVVISRYLSDPDPLLVLEAARAINDVPIKSALPALAELAEPARLDALLRQFAALGVGRAASLPDRSGDSTRAGWQLALRDVRSDQPLPWGDAPIDHLTPMLLRVVNANFRVGTPESAHRLVALAARTDLPVLIRTEALNALATWAKPFPRDRIVGTYRPLRARDPAPARDALGNSLRALAVFQPPPPLSAEQQARVDRTAAEDPGFQFLDTRHTTEVPEAVLSATATAVLRLAPPEGTDLLFRMVASQAPTGARATALRCLAELATADSTAGVTIRFENGRATVDNPSGDPAVARQYWMLGTALQLAASSPEEILRLEASRISAVLNPADAAGQLGAQLTGGSLAEQQSAYASLGDLKSDAADALLVEALDRLMKREVANEVMLDLVLAASKREASAVKTRLAAYQDWKLPKDHLSPYREALFGGDAARGKKIFYENAAVACTRCHQIGGDGGGNAGPKLDGLASRVTREHLLESVVLPNQEVVQGFESAMITLKNGQTYAGVVKSESDAELVLISPEEGDVTLKKPDVATREKGLSGMPEGLATLLSPMELRDVIEFLGTLR